MGECGLDYFYEHSPRPAQREVFAEQIGLARRLGLALVIHARDAWDDLFDVLAAEGVPDRTVLHCFTGGPTEARRCLNAGMVLSFAGVVTFKNAADVRAAAELCPLDRLLVETDSPFLTPVPFRGKPTSRPGCRWSARRSPRSRGARPPKSAAASAAAAAAVFAVPAPGDAGSGLSPEGRSRGRRAGHGHHRRVTLTEGDVQRLLADHSLRPSRALGQNFVVDPNTVRRIVQLAEVGPATGWSRSGPDGLLTVALAEAGAEVLAVEVDRHLVPRAGPRWWRAGRYGWWRPTPCGATGQTCSVRPPWSLVANLPYNVATPVVIRVLEEAPTVGRLLVMVQREVASGWPPTRATRPTGRSR